MKIKQETKSTKKLVVKSIKNRRNAKSILLESGEDTKDCAEALPSEVFSEEEIESHVVNNPAAEQMALATQLDMEPAISEDVDTTMYTGGRSRVDTRSPIDRTLDEIPEEQSNNLFDVGLPSGVGAFSTWFAANSSANFNYVYPNLQFREPPSIYTGVNPYDIVRKSMSLNADIDLKILLHENIKISKQANGNVESSNSLFLTREDIENKSFLNMKNSEISKCESINDKLFIYLKEENHHDAVSSSIERSNFILDTLDEITSFSNKNEREINYANIVEKFINNGSSKFISKASNTFFDNNNQEINTNFISSPANEDERLLDKQTNFDSSVISSEDLRLFYENISGFTLTETSGESNLNYLNRAILNSDRLVGQLMLNLGLSMYSLYPNTDLVQNINLKLFRSEINSSAWNKYPIIQTCDLNLNSRIFTDSIDGLTWANESSPNREILNIKKGSFSTANFNYMDAQYLFNVNSENYNKLIFPSNSENLLYDNKFSLFGKKNPQKENTQFDNNVVKFIFRDSLDSKKIFEVVYFDTISDYEKTPILSPTFFALPERYFNSDFLLKYAIPSFIGAQLDGGVQAYINSYTGNASEIKTAINKSFFNNFTAQNWTEPGDDGRPVRKEVPVLQNTVHNYLINKLSQVYLSNMRNSFKNNENGGDINESSSEYQFTHELIDNSYTYSVYAEKMLDLSIARKNQESSTALYDYLSDFEGIDDLSEYQFSGGEEQLESLSNLSGIIGLNFNNEQPNNFSSLKNKLDFCVFESSNSIINEDELFRLSFGTDVSGFSYGPSLLWDPSSLKYVKRISERQLSGQISKSDGNFIYDLLKRDSDILKFSNLSLEIAQSVNIVKRNLDKTTMSVFDDYIKKCSSKFKQGDKFILLYDKFEETCIDTFNNSPFITKEKAYKNNYAKEFSTIKNSSQNYYSNKSLNEDHMFTSEQYRKYLSKTYTKSFLKNKTTALKSIINNCIEIFTNNEYHDDAYFGFDVLLASAILDRDKENDTSLNKIIKLFLANSIAEICDLDSQASLLYKQPVITKQEGQSSEHSNKSFYDAIAKIYSPEFASDVVNFVFSANNVKSQKSYIISAIKSIDKHNLPISASNGLGGLNIKKVPNITFSLMFPFITKIRLESTSDTHPLPVASQSFYINNINNITSVSSNNDTVKQVKDFASELSYNYDIFIDEENSGVVKYKIEDDIQKILGYNFNKKNEEQGSDLNICYFNYRNTKDLNIDYEKPEPEIPYGKIEKFIPFSYFFLSKRNNTFSSKITKTCKDLINLFDIDFDQFNTFNDILDFIDQNEFYIKCLYHYLKAFSRVFLSSYNNYITVLIENFYNKVNTDSWSDQSVQTEIKNAISKFRFVNGDLELKTKAVGDISAIINHQRLNEKSFIKENLFYSFDQYLNNNADLEMYSFRSIELQNTFKILNNSDIAEGLSHDIVHGYFLNYESNNNEREESIDRYRQNMQEIASEINKSKDVQISQLNLQQILKSEFYQNKVSKDLQEIMYYKNIFKETFVENNAYSVLEEKYKNINLFNHRKFFYANKYKHAIEASKNITASLNDNSLSNFELIRLPISYQLANKVGERGIIQIDILPVNIKYPEIEFRKLTYFYSPMLTTVTSNFVNSLSGTLNNFVGIYDDNAKISKRYAVIDTASAMNEVSRLVTDILKINNLDIDDGYVSSVSNTLVNNLLTSNNIKYLSFVTQKDFDENIKNLSIDTQNLISTNTLNLISTIKNKNLHKVFKNFDLDSLSQTAGDVYTNLDTNDSILENQEFYKKFIVNLDKDVSNSEIVKTMIPNRFYDTFNIAINRDNLLPADSYEEILFRSSSIGKDNDINRAFNFYVCSKVL